MNPLSRALPVIAAALLLGNLAGAQVLYKYLGPDGKTVYSDKPPPPGVKFQTLQPNTAPTGVDLRPRGGTAESQAVDAQLRERQLKQAEQQDKVSRLQFDYETALNALEQTKQPRDGDRTMNANGTSRLSEEYLKRVEQAEQAVEAARQKLEEARRQ
jgi:hypothetical protein